MFLALLWHFSWMTSCGCQNQLLTGTSGGHTPSTVMWRVDSWFYCLSRNPCFPSQVWRWLHGDCPGRRISPSAEASRGFCPEDVPWQHSEGEASQHTAISVPLCVGSLGQHFQTVFQPAAEAGNRRLLCVPDHPGSGEARNLGKWQSSILFLLRFVNKT